MKTFTQYLNEVSVPFRKVIAKKRAYRTGYDAGMARDRPLRSLHHPLQPYSTELKNIRGVEAASGVPLHKRSSTPSPRDSKKVGSEVGADITPAPANFTIHPKLHKEIKRGQKAGAKQAKKQYWQ